MEEGLSSFFQAPDLRLEMSVDTRTIAQRREVYYSSLEDLRAFKREGALLLTASKPDLRTPAPGYTIY